MCDEYSDEVPFEHLRTSRSMIVVVLYNMQDIKRKSTRKFKHFIKKYKAKIQ